MLAIPAIANLFTAGCWQLIAVGRLRYGPMLATSVVSNLHDVGIALLSQMCAKGHDGSLLLPVCIKVHAERTMCTTGMW